jgi:V/A-type H+-transporting ATPase subunit D
MSISVSANRMNLLRLKKKVITAERGHKLMKDKQDELIRIFFLLINEIKGARGELEKKLAELYKESKLALILSGTGDSQSASSAPTATIKAGSKLVSVLNLRVPELKVEMKGELRSWSSGEAPASLDIAAQKAAALLPDLIKLAEIEHKVKLVGLEIEQTRRRVNALEYNLIPGLVENIKSISLKLSEMERSNLSRLMAVKEIVKG